MPSLCDFSRERALHARGLRLVAGVDEVGRGPLAGPVAAAAVVLDPARVPDGLDDSKRCDGVRRETLYEAIMASALGVGIAFVPPRRIDAINIRQATLLAMRRAVAGLAVRPDHILVDGNDLPPELPCPAITIIDGDALVASIAAASIVAKVVRDRLMTRLGLGCPGYAFEAHKGYATPVHRAAIARHGPCAHHRVSFAPFRNGTEAA